MYSLFNFVFNVVYVVVVNGGKGCFKCGEVGYFVKECFNNGIE